ncbi:hypothetical protein PGTUg99_030983 [Puccinia graminis f. sp. tritici]|uniref:Uncharacterized protein n=1 Tax=Puccinia graminis f. sp. tritici TaxID=56615 RepID=A0A5B0SNF7_PUCGR|nr:hypothetical protein PGTUg99_030983 [Puccinia graminis f. sp. tritici]
MCSFKCRSGASEFRGTDIARAQPAVSEGADEALQMTEPAWLKTSWDDPICVCTLAIRSSVHGQRDCGCACLSWEQHIHPQTELSTSTSGAARRAQDKKHNIKTSKYKTESNRIAKKSYIVVCLFENPKLLRVQMDIAHYS